MAQASPSSIHELLIQRLGLLCALGDSLEQAQAALATATPKELDHHTARQRELCRQLRTLASEFPGEAQIQIPVRMAGDLQAAERRAADLNRLYGALLRRRRRTADIFCRVLASSGTTYPAPKLLCRRD